MLFGRITYELMESYWPNAKPENDDPRIIEAMNNYPKIVFSRTIENIKPALQHGKWKNCTFIKGDAVKAIEELKKKPGKNMVIYGSGSIVAYLQGKNLIDDFRIFVHPIILGSGKRMFKTGIRSTLKLVDTRKFKSGLVLLHYLI